jgi:hypothetical protein
MNLIADGHASRRDLTLNDSLLAAFAAAWYAFEDTYGREPEVASLSFRGGFSTVECVFEIEEESWDD